MRSVNLIFSLILVLLVSHVYACPYAAGKKQQQTKTSAPEPSKKPVKRTKNGPVSMKEIDSKASSKSGKSVDDKASTGKMAANKTAQASDDKEGCHCNGGNSIIASAGLAVVVILLMA